MLIGGCSKRGGDGIRNVPYQRRQRLHDWEVDDRSEAPQIPHVATHVHPF